MKTKTLHSYAVSFSDDIIKAVPNYSYIDSASLTLTPLQFRAIQEALTFNANNSLIDIPEFRLEISDLSQLKIMDNKGREQEKIPAIFFRMWLVITPSIIKSKYAPTATLISLNGKGINIFESYFNTDIFN